MTLRFSYKRKRHPCAKAVALSLSKSGVMATASNYRSMLRQATYDTTGYRLSPSLMTNITLIADLHHPNSVSFTRPL